MQNQPRHRANGRVPTKTALLGLLVVGLIIGALVIVNQFVGPANQARQLAVAIIQQEDQQLPSYEGTPPDQLIIRNEPFVSPVLISSYYLSGTCIDVQHYYASVAPSMRWQPQGGIRTYNDPFHPNDSSQRLLHSEFTKSIQSIHLQLVIECYASSHSYSLSISEN